MNKLQIHTHTCMNFFFLFFMFSGMMLTSLGNNSSTRESTDKEQSSTPLRKMDKENENKLLPMSKKILYAPAVNSPLVNDIADIDKEST